jgi:hypothetical protein
MSSSSLVLQPPSPSAHFINDEYANDVDSAMEIEKSEEVSTQNTLKDLTTIIFDWDDTLLPSSWLSVKGLRLDYPAQLPEDVLDELKTHQESVCAVLVKAMQCGTVVIITNAETGWVELSAQRFMPRVAPLLASICVFSARSTYEPMYPNDPLQWKVAAFKQLVGHTQPMNIVEDAVTKNNANGVGRDCSPSTNDAALDHIDSDAACQEHQGRQECQFSGTGMCIQ